MDLSLKRTLVRALGNTAQAGLQAAATTAPLTGATGKRRTTKAPCTPCAAAAALRAAKAAAKKGQL